MRTAIALAVVLAFSVPFSAHATVITVDCEGGADYSDPVQAFLHSASGDTILLAPCVYHVLPTNPPHLGWPIVVSSPWTLTIVGREGAASTVLEGNGTCSAIAVSGGGGGSTVTLRGLTFRNVVEALERPPEVYISLYFTDNVVEGCTKGLGADCAGGVVARNVIRNNGGWSGIEIYHFSGLIEDNEICYNQSGIHGVCCETPRIRRNHIHHNAQTGIVPGFWLHATYNLIEANGGAGVSLPAAQGTLTHNVIRGNAIGVRGYHQMAIALHNNDIYGNTVYNASYDSSDGPWTLDATMNWWGTTDPDQIAAGIHDRNDDPTLGCWILFDPWCVAPGCDATSIRASSWGCIKALFGR